MYRYPRLRFSTVFAVIALAPLFFLGRIALRMITGHAGDDDIIPFAYSMPACIAVGIAGLIVAFAGVPKVPRWQWTIELSVCATAALAGLVAFALAMR